MKKFIKMTKPLTSKKLFERMTGCIPADAEHDQLRKKLAIWNGLADHAVLDESARRSIYYNTLDCYLVSPYDTWEVELMQLFLIDWANYNFTQTKDLRDRIMKLEKIKLGLIEGLQGS